MRYLIPKMLFDKLASKILNSIVNQKAFGFNPRAPPSRASIMTSDDLVPLVGSGRIAVHTHGIEQLSGNDVILKDESTIRDIDTIVCATGYRCDYSIFGQTIFGGPVFEDTRLYQNVWPITAEYNNSIALIGVVTLDGAVPTVQVSH